MAKKSIAGPQVHCRHDKMAPIATLVPHSQNPNRHPQAQIEILAHIIKKQGWRQPITVSKRSGFIIRGHGRLEAARFLGLTHVPVEIQNYKNEQEEKADLLADNNIAAYAEMDSALVDDIVHELDLAGFDTSLTGLSVEDLTDMLDDGKDGADDPAPGPIAKAVSKPGDIYQLGPHRLMCGSTTDKKDMAALMDGGKADLIFTDPPYGVDYESDSQGKIMGDKEKGNDLVNTLLLPSMKNFVAFAKDTAAFFIWHASVTREDFKYAMNAAGLEEKQYIIWLKPTFALGRADYQWRHEPCFYAQKAGRRAKFNGDRDQSTVWEIAAVGPSKGQFAISNGIRLSQGSGAEIYIKTTAPKGNKARMIRLNAGDKIALTADDGRSDVWSVSPDNRQEYVHPTQKPTELAARALRNHTDQGAIVLDGFGGSGSTLIACEKFGRAARIMELDPKFVDVIVARWDKYMTKQGIAHKVIKNGKEAGHVA